MRETWRLDGGKLWVRQGDHWREATNAECCNYFAAQIEAAPAPADLDDVAVLRRAVDVAREYGYPGNAQRNEELIVAIEAARRAPTLLEALKAMLAKAEREACRHESTHRGGAIWEICDDCGAKWADDRGGKPAWVDPPEWGSARRAIADAEKERPDA